MKIVVDARFYGLEHTGPGRYTINLINQLQRIDRKNEYIILLRKKYFDILKFESNFEKVLAEIPHYSFKEQIMLPKITEKHKPDLTHFLFFNVPINFKGKFVVTIHDMTMHSQKTNATNLMLPVYYAKHLAYKKVFKNAVLKSEKIIVPSQFVKDELVKNFKTEKEKVNVIYEGVNNSHLETHSFGPRKGVASRLYFFYFWNAYPHKNLEIAIKACVHLKVNLYIVSKKNKFTEKLQKLMSKLGAQKYIKFLGYVEDENLQKLYENSVGFIYPSLSEGFGLPGLEALKAGTILLCSNIPVFKEIYGNHAIYFNPTEQSSIEAAIKKTHELKKQEAEKMIRESRKFVQRYSWEKMAKQTIQIYETLVS